jgi:hypothetical protein
VVIEIFTYKIPRVELESGGLVYIILYTSSNILRGKLGLSVQYRYSTVPYRQGIKIAPPPFFP